MNITELKVEMTRHGMSVCDLANKIGISKKAMYAKLARKSQFTQPEIVAIRSALKLNDKRMIEIFFDRSVF